jgi:hypothetical protein
MCLLKMGKAILFLYSLQLKQEMLPVQKQCIKTRPTFKSICLPYVGYITDCTFIRNNKLSAPTMPSDTCKEIQVLCRKQLKKKQSYINNSNFPFPYIRANFRRLHNLSELRVCVTR